MITIMIPKEIEEYEEKIIFGLSLRKLVSLLIALPLAIFIYFIGQKLQVNSEILGYIIMIFTFPILAEGFIKIRGFKCSKYLKIIIRHKLARSRLVYNCYPLSDLILKDKDIERNNNRAIVQKQGRKKTTERIETKKTNSKANRKKALKTIKRTRKEFRKLQQNIKK